MKSSLEVCTESREKMLSHIFTMKWVGILLKPTIMYNPCMYGSVHAVISLLFPFQL